MDERRAMNSVDGQQPPDSSRRAFLRASGGVVGSSWLALSFPGLLGVAKAAAAAREAGAVFLHLSLAEAAGLEAIAARIIPTDETPGAREAGVIHFIDQALASFMAGSAGELRAGLETLDGLAASTRDGQCFAQLEPGVQDELIARIENTPFFELMHYLTVAGMFSLPGHGGNRDYLGWQLLGLSHRHAWAPPFGFYDAEAMGVPPPGAADDGAHNHG
jgi:gluconate 2-dehydrogenase gamma chain